jgi:hypothetical protein
VLPLVAGLLQQLICSAASVQDQSSRCRSRIAEQHHTCLPGLHALMAAPLVSRKTTGFEPTHWRQPARHGGITYCISSSPGSITSISLMSSGVGQECSRAVRVHACLQGAGLVTELTTCWALVSLTRCAELARQMDISVPLYTGSIYQPVGLQHSNIGLVCKRPSVLLQCRAVASVYPCTL